jgi:5S rRNA maturation endonuclease (ribonuclease M5)
MKYDGLIEYINSLTDRLQAEKYPDFYWCFNIFSDDHNSKSACIWRDDGTLQMHNATGEDGRTRYTLVEWISELGYIDIFVKWICKQENISPETMSFYDYVLRKDFNFRSPKEKIAYGEIKRIFFNKYFLSTSKIINRRFINKIISSETFKPKDKAKNTSVKISPPLDSHLKQIEDYMLYRGLEESDICYPVTVHINGFMKKAGVCFEYPNGFRKVRYVGYKKEDGRYYDYNKKYKFTASSEFGRYEELYAIRFGDSVTAIISEGETEGHMLAKYIPKFDVYTSHNAVAMADKSNVLSKYDRVIVFLDLDRYEEIKDGVKQSILKTAVNAKVSVLPKFNKELQEKICKKYDIENTDFNDLFTRNEEELKKILGIYFKKIDTV